MAKRQDREESLLQRILKVYLLCRWPINRKTKASQSLREFNYDRFEGQNCPFSPLFSLFPSSILSKAASRLQAVIWARELKLSMNGVCVVCVKTDLSRGREFFQHVQRFVSFPIKTKSDINGQLIYRSFHSFPHSSFYFSENCPQGGTSKRMIFFKEMQKGGLLHRIKFRLGKNTFRIFPFQLTTTTHEICKMNDELEKENRPCASPLWSHYAKDEERKNATKGCSFASYISSNKIYLSQSLKK